MRALAMSVVIGLSMSAAAQAAAGDVVLQTDAIRLRINAQGRVMSLRDRLGDRELCVPDRPAFRVRKGKQWAECSAVHQEGAMLKVRFDGLSTEAQIEATVRPRYIVLRLKRLTGAAVDSLELLALALEPLATFDRWLGVVYDDRFAVVVCAGDYFTRHQARKEDGADTIRLLCEREVRQEGNQAVLLGCPTSEVLDYVDTVEADLGLPRGARHRQHPLQRRSYLWCSPTPENIGEYIAWAKRGGFGQITISYTAFTKSCGHFEFRPSYPNGIADLKQVVDSIHGAGLAAGFHIHFNKAHLHDPYVTPVPDKRFHKLATLRLAAPLSAGAERIVTRERPVKCDVDDRRRVLHVGDELIRYKSVESEPPYGFSGCARGALRTKAAAHSDGAALSLLNVDTWPIFIRFDQWTDIQQETAQRLADIYNQAGFDFVYFDGSEDVHNPYWYFCPKAQWEVYTRLKPEPVVCEGAARGHFSWHMLTRSNAYDSVRPERMKSLCRRYPCRAAPRTAVSFTRINFGWLTYGTRNAASVGAQPDVYEFIASRGAGYDCPLSLTVSLSRLEENERTADNFEVLRRWEQARLAGAVTPEIRESLRTTTQEHILLVDEKGRYEVQPYWEIKGLFTDRVPKAPAAKPGDKSFAGRFEYEVIPELRVFHFMRRGKVWVAYWHAFDQARLELPAPPAAVRLFEELGRPTPVLASTGQSVTLPVGRRRFVEFTGLDQAAVVAAFRGSKLIPRQAWARYVQAEDAARLVGKMALGSSVGVQAPGAMDDVVVPTGGAAPDTRPQWFAEFTMAVPERRAYTVWARVWYPDTSHNSFSLASGDALNPGTKFGNSMRFHEWFWDGGNRLKLEAGPQRIRVYVREGNRDPRRSPRLDVLCITDSKAYLPTDLAAGRALGRPGDGAKR